MKEAEHWIAVGSLYFAKQYRCRQRNADSDRHIATTKRDADQPLKVGTKKAAVSRFYTEQKIPFEVEMWPDGGYEVIGSLYTVGDCTPLGCGTDRALLVGKPEVVTMYTDCL